MVWDLGLTVKIGDTKAICLDYSRRGNDSHGVFLIEDKGQKFAVKIYGYKRNKIAHFFKNIDSRISGKSSESYQARYQNELKVMARWREHGYLVFEQKENFPLAVATPYVVMEYVEGETIFEYFLRETTTLEQKIEILSHFAPVWGERHNRAYQSKDFLLIQEHPTFKHVFLAKDGRQIYFDFEIVYERGNIKELIAEEIAGYIRSLYKITPDYQRKSVFHALIENYPHSEFLHYPYIYFFRSPSVTGKIIHKINHQVPRNQRPHSKYQIALLLEQYLSDRS